MIDETASRFVPATIHLETGWSPDPVEKGIDIVSRDDRYQLQEVARMPTRAFHQVARVRRSTDNFCIGLITSRYKLFFSPPLSYIVTLRVLPSECYRFVVHLSCNII